MDSNRTGNETMIKKLLCGSFALGSSLGLLLAADAFTGSWKLDVAKSTFASDNPAPTQDSPEREARAETEPATHHG